MPALPWSNPNETAVDPGLAWFAKVGMVYFDPGIGSRSFVYLASILGEWTFSRSNRVPRGTGKA
jgi:hypothetical protein